VSLSGADLLSARREVEGEVSLKKYLTVVGYCRDIDSCCRTWSVLHASAVECRSFLPVTLATGI